MPGIWLGLDLGNARVGVAASNPERSFAYPEGNIRVYGDYFQVFDDVLDLIEDKAEEGTPVTAIAIGLPLQMDGSAGSSAKRRSGGRNRCAEDSSPKWKTRTLTSA